jgi:AcrR family transcriptional regulator
MNRSSEDLSSTPSRILAEASRLFAINGFHGTSTRDIADAVGIRQPSLFHHFATKHAILATLLDLDLDQLTRRMKVLGKSSQPAAVKLHAHLALDVTHVLEFPFDVRGLYFKNETVPAGDEFTDQRKKLDAVHRQIRALVKAAVSERQFRPTDPEFVRLLISSTIIGVMWTRGPDPNRGSSSRSHELPDFILRALLERPDDLPMVKTASETLQQAVRTHFRTD